MDTYKVSKATGIIYCPDGSTISPPYDDPKYADYAIWVQSGNSPEELDSDSMVADEDIEVRSAQAKIALVHTGFYDAVLQIMADPNTPIEVKLKWEYETVFKRNDPVIIQMAGLLKRNRDELTALFQYAKLIP